MEHDHELSADTDSAHLRAEIRETRERMSETLDELGTRLNPNRIKAQVRENIREATVGRVENMARHAADRVNDTRDGIIDTIRDNPIPAAMIGIGLGWMLFNGRRGEHHGHRHDTRWEELPYYGDISGATPRLRQDDAAGGIGASTSHWEEPGLIDNAREKVSDVADRAGERVSDVAHRVSHAVSDVGDGARHTAYRVEDRFQRTMHENPLAIGAAAVALGMAAGFAIPETRRESQLMGSARDQLLNRVKDAAEDARDRVQDVAERVVDEAKQTVREDLS